MLTVNKSLFTLLILYLFSPFVKTKNEHYYLLIFLVPISVNWPAVSFVSSIMSSVPFGSESRECSSSFARFLFYSNFKNLF